MIFNRQSMSGNLSTTLIISGVVLAIGGTFLMVFLPMLAKPKADLLLGDGVFKIDVALNRVDREKGLSGKTEFGADHALLMVFPNEAKRSVWMKKMNFPIDIVWLNKDKKVVYIVKNAPIDNPTKIYGPETPAQYVIELAAGTTTSKSITVNKTATFQIDTVGQE